jgi:hypothetical protein
MREVSARTGEESYRRPPGVFVLDLMGLSWYEAGIADRTPLWLQQNVASRHIGLAMLYPSIFDAPSAWKDIGQLCIDTPSPIVVADRCVEFYCTTPQSAAEIQSELHQFVPTLPPGSSFTFGSAQTGDER